MAQFKYKARNPEGRVMDGTIEAETEELARSVLRGRKYAILELSKAGGGLFRRGPKVKRVDVVIFSRQLATMVAAGLPLVQAVSIIGDQTPSKALKAVLTSVRDDVSSGGNFSEALAKHPNAFIPLYVNMVKAGESGGNLDVILERLSTYLEDSEALKQKIQGAMMYPAVILTVAIGVVVFLMVKVIPSFKDVFSQSGKVLPVPTQMLLATSEFLQTKIQYIIGIIVGIVFGFGALKRTEQGAMVIDATMLKLPLFGSLIQRISVARFARTLGTLQKSGVPILEGMEIVARTAGNKVVENAIFKARSSIREGEGISGPLRAVGVFPPMVIQMVHAGEETGKLDDMLARIADFYDAEVGNTVENLVKLIEPLIMVLMGGTVAMIVLGMFMPMFEMSSMAGG